MPPRPRTVRPATDSLSRREREIMHAIFALGNRASAEEIRGRLTDPPGYSAIRAMLVRLEAKGHLRHEQDGQRYIYSATASPLAARRASLRQHVQTFFDGSLGSLVTTLLRSESWTNEELDAIRREIDAARTSNRKKG